MAVTRGQVFFLIWITSGRFFVGAFLKTTGLRLLGEGGLLGWIRIELNKWRIGNKKVKPESK